MNLAQPFSSGAEGPAAHILEPTSLAAPGAADIWFTGSSKTAVHVVPARGRDNSQKQARLVYDRQGRSSIIWRWVEGSTELSRNTRCSQLRNSRGALYEVSERTGLPSWCLLALCRGYYGLRPWDTGCKGLWGPDTSSTAIEHMYRHQCLLMPCFTGTCEVSSGLQES